MKKKTNNAYSRSLATREASTGGIGKVMRSKKFLVITSVVLMVAVFSSVLMFGAVPGSRMGAMAGSASLSSISGENVIPDVYSPVNVGAGTYTMTATQYGNNDVGKSADGIAAFDFHIFADRFASSAHTCGNIAVNLLGAEVLGKTGAPEFGSRPKHDVDSTKLSYVGDLYGWSASTGISKDNYQVFGPNVEVTSSNGPVYIETADGKSLLMGNDNGGSLTNNIYKETTANSYINIQKELTEAEDYMRWLVWLMEQEENDVSRDNLVTADKMEAQSVKYLSYNDIAFSGPVGPGGMFGPGPGFFGPGGTNIDFNRLVNKNDNVDTIIVDLSSYVMPSMWGNMTVNEATQLISGKVDLKGTVGKRIIFNIDASAVGDKFKFADTNMTADKLTNSEDSALKDNNILWNFYVKDDNGVPRSYDGVIEIGGTWMGTILAPEATVYCRAGLNGSIIAKYVTTTAETHKSDYTGERVVDDKIDLTVTKIWEDDPTMRPPYITLQLLRDGKIISTVQVSTANIESNSTNYKWFYKFKDLPAADPMGNTYQYKVKELEVSGYKTQQVNNTIINTSTNTNIAPVVYKLTVNKVNGSGNKLAGATLRLTSNNGANLSVVTVGDVSGAKEGSVKINDKEIVWISDGSSVVIGNLPAGTYTVSEVTAPDGYKLADPTIVTLDASTKPVNVINTPIEVKFNKINGASSHNAILPGAVFALTPNWGDNLSNVDVSGAANVNKAADKITFTTANSTITFKGIPEGSYTLTETSAPTGYQQAAPITFIIDAAGNVTVNGAVDNDKTLEMTNTLIPKNPATYNLTVNKTGEDEDGNLAGATLVLTAVDKNANLSNVTGGTVDNTKKTVTWITGESATVISNLPEGNYVLTETKAPAGYKLAAPVSVSLTGGESDTAVEHSATMRDELIKVIVEKLDSLSGGFVSGANLSVTGTTLDGVNYSDSWTSDGSAHVLTNISAGTYTLTEAAPAPAGYQLAEPVQFKVDENGNVTVKENDKYVAASKVTMYDIPNQIQIAKQFWAEDTNTTGLLGGATLNLKPNAGQSLANVSGSIPVNHNEDGSITWTSSGSAANSLRGVPDGKYILSELSAPAGYESANAVTINVSGSTVSFVDDPSNPGDKIENNVLYLTDKKEIFYPLKVTKIDKDDKDRNPLPGAVLAIFKEGTTVFNRENAELVFTTTNTSSQFVLPDGDYILAELTAPAGYDRTEELVHFTIKTNGNIEVGEVTTPDDPSNNNGGGSGNGGAGTINLSTTQFTVGSLPGVSDMDYYDGRITVDITDNVKKYGTPVSITFNAQNSIVDGNLLQKGKVRVLVSDDLAAFNIYDSFYETDCKAGSTTELYYGSAPSKNYFALSIILECEGGKLTDEQIAELGLSAAIVFKDENDTPHTQNVGGVVSGASNYALTSGNSTNGFVLAEVGEGKGPNGINTNGLLNNIGYSGCAYIDITAAVKTSGEFPKTATIPIDIQGKEYKFDNRYAAIVKGDGTVVASASYDSVSDTNGYTYTSTFKDWQQTTVEADASYYFFFLFNASINNSTSKILTAEQFARSGITGVSLSYQNASTNTSGSYYDPATQDPPAVTPPAVTPPASDPNLTPGDIPVVQPSGGEPVHIMLPNSSTPAEELYKYSVKLEKFDTSKGKITDGTAKFNLYDSNGTVIKADDKGNGTYTYNANGAVTEFATVNGMITVNGLPVGDYVFYETEAPTGYIVGVYEGTTVPKGYFAGSDAIGVTADKDNTSDNPASVKVMDEAQRRTLTINKVDTNGNPLTDAVFELYYAPVVDADPDYVDYANAQRVGVDGNGQSKTYTTGEGGKIVVSSSDLQGKNGVFFVKEQTAPTGMVKADGYWPQLTSSTDVSDGEVSEGNIYFNDAYLYGVALGDGIPANLLMYTYEDSDGDGVIETTDKITGADYTTTTINGAYEASIIVTNKPGEVQFAKVDANTDANVSGAVLKLVPANNGATTTSKPVPALSAVYATVDIDGVETRVPITDNYTIKYNENGTVLGMKEEYLTWTSRDQIVTLHGLPKGTYTLTEVTAPEGYEKTDASVTVNVEDDGTVTGNGVIKLENELLTGKIILTKIDAVNGDRIDGAGFELYDSEGNAVKAVLNNDGTYTCDADGTVTVFSTVDGYITVDGLAWGESYKFKEVTAAPGYILPTSGAEFTEEIEITKENLSSAIEVFVTNARDDAGQITLYKTDAVDGSYIGGAKFDLYRRLAGTGLDFEHYAEYTTVAGSPLVISDLPWGYEYKLVEDESDNGYDHNSIIFAEGVDSVTLTDTNLTGEIRATNRKLIDITVTKVWEDGNDQDSKRPDYITVQLMADGQPVQGQEVRLSGETDRWTHVFTDLPVVNDSKVAINYTVVETGVPEGYSSIPSGDVVNGFVITNRYTPSVININVTKVWNDDSDRDGKRPESIDVKLLAGGVDTGKIITLDSSNDWKASFNGLAKMADGVDIVYSVAEVSTDSDDYTGVVTGDILTGFTITNTHETEKIDISATKIWNDDFNRDQVRPGKITFNLMNGSTVVSTADLDTAADEASVTWTGLPKNENVNGESKAINYTIAEVLEPASTDYAMSQTKEVDDNGNISFEVTNTYNPEVISITATKVWDHKGYTGEVPASVTVQLTANGQPVEGKSAVLSGDNLTVVWNNLPKNSNGAPIVYTVTESPRIDGYDANVSEVDENGVITITNTRQTNGKIVVTKIDKDDESAIPNVKFKLLYKLPSETEFTRYYMVNEAEWVGTTDNNGQIEIDGLHWGYDYRLEEVEAAPGYVSTPIFEEDDEMIVFDKDVRECQVTIKNVRVTTSVIFSKVIFGTTEELPGATLTITHKGGASLAGVAAHKGENTTVSNLSTEVNSFKWISCETPVAISGLPVGSYSFTETTAPYGYEKDETKEFEIKDDGKVYVNNAPVNDFNILIMEDKPHTVTISKEQAGGGGEVPNAQLTLTLIKPFNEDLSVGKVTLENVTGSVSTPVYDPATNSVKWSSVNTANVLSAVPDGIYSLEETMVPNGYEKAETMYFKVEDGKVYNTTEYAGEQTVWSTVSVDKVVMFDELSTGSATISKQEVGGGPEIPGATLTVTLISAEAGSKATLNNVTGTVTGTVADANTVTWVSGDNANTLTALPDGIYELTEEFAPDGYKVSEEKMYFKVDNGVIYNTVDYTGETTVWTAVSADAEADVIMEDAPMTATISKVETGSGDEVIGAELTITLIEPTNEGATLENVTGSIEGTVATEDTVTWISGDKANELSRLPDGIYELAEVLTPDGYREAEKIYFKVEGEKVFNTTRYNENGTTNWTEVDADAEADVIMEDAPMSATISKVETGSGDEIIGAELTITLVEPADEDATLENVTGSVEGTVATENTVTWISGEEDNVLSRLPDGIYRLTEVTEPDGYKVAEEIYFKVEDEKVYNTTNYDGDNTEWDEVDDETVIMEDAPMTATISKQEVGGGDELAGATLTVTLINPEVKDTTLEKVTGSIKVTYEPETNSVTWKSGDKANILSRLPDGIYTLTEVAAPLGYDIAEVMYFKVDADKVYNTTEYKAAETVWTEAANDTVVMYDALSPADGTASFIKKSDLGKPLAGAVFTLTDSTGKTSTATSNAEGVVSFTGLDAGEYKLVETSAPTGYTKSNHEVTVKVDDRGNVAWYTAAGDGITVTSVETLFTNAYIIQQGTTNDKPVVGGQIDLSDDLDSSLKDLDVKWESKNPDIAEVDQNGIVTIKKPGNFTITVTHNGKPVQNFVLGATDTSNPGNTPNTGTDIVRISTTISAALLGAFGIITAFVYGYKRKKAGSTSAK